MTIIHNRFRQSIGQGAGREALGSERRRVREKEQRRSAILRAARKEFFEKGFRAVTVDSIARRAELSKGAIYLYFKSKEEIYAQILLRDIDKFHEKVATLLDTSKSASENLRSFAEVYAAFFISDRELFRIFMNFMIQHNPVNFTPNINDHIVRSTNQTVVIIEQIFALPGIGPLAINATALGDIPIVMGVVLVTVTIVIIVNLLVDLANGALNPKVRVS